MAIRAVVFDFDGTLLDTESCAYDAFSGIFHEHGHKLPIEAWAVGIGTHGAFDPYGLLEELTGKTLDRAAIKAQYEAAHHANIAKNSLFPGVIDRLEEARELGLKIGLASSSGREWIERHLASQGIRPYFEIIRSSDDVEKVKPDPALYRLAVEGLGVRADEAIAIEDSLNGLRAAKAAGLYGCVVPNQVTRQMDFSEADLVVGSMTELSFGQIVRQRLR
jgi:putative hydrolase of the HAD superfamily